MCARGQLEICHERHLLHGTTGVGCQHSLLGPCDHAYVGHVCLCSRSTTLVPTTSWALSALGWAVHHGATHRS